MYRFRSLPILAFSILLTTHFPACAETSAEAAAVAAPSPVVAQARAQLESMKKRYETIAQQGGWPAFPKGATLKPGMEDERITVLRTVLTATGDLPESSNATENATHYDKALQQAMERFQARHALKADGSIGRDTQTQLAVPVEERLAQMQVTLDAMNEAPAQPGERYVLVNVPGYYLTAVDHEKVALISRVIVGSPKNATPLFANEITDINFNPAWHVPARIASQELAAKEHRNPGYLSRAGFRLTDSNGDTVSPSEVDWSRPGAYRFRQSPGDGNALGKIKFNIPNDYNVYLHSTASPQLFAKDYRALSHGCVRVEDTRGLAHFALGDMEGWSNERVDQTYDSSTSRTVKLEKPLPVYLVYWPVWVDPQKNEVHFHPDIYGKHTTRVAELLRAREVNMAMNQ